MQLCDGANAEERKRWFLRPAQEFHYLNQSSCYKLNRVDNADEFQVSHPQSIRWVKKAQKRSSSLETLRINECHADILWATLSRVHA